LTAGVNPLKLREYLAAGLPALSTPLPEARSVDHIQIVENAGDVSRALESIDADDTPEQRKARKASVQNDGWAARVTKLREILGLHEVTP